MKVKNNVKLVKKKEKKVWFYRDLNRGLQIRRRVTKPLGHRGLSQ
jgi:hypothetical protein